MKKIQLRIICETPENIFLEEVSTFLSNVNLLLNKILLYYGSGKNLMYTLRKRKIKEKIYLKELHTGSFEIVLIILAYRLPEIITSIAKLLKVIRERRRIENVEKETKKEVKNLLRCSEKESEELTYLLSPIIKRLSKSKIRIISIAEIKNDFQGRKNETNIT